MQRYKETLNQIETMLRNGQTSNPSHLRQLHMHTQTLSEYLQEIEAAPNQEEKVQALMEIKAVLEETNASLKQQLEAANLEVDKATMSLMDHKKEIKNLKTELTKLKKDNNGTT